MTIDEEEVDLMNGHEANRRDTDKEYTESEEFTYGEEGATKNLEEDGKESDDEREEIFALMDELEEMDEAAVLTKGLPEDYKSTKGMMGVTTDEEKAEVLARKIASFATRCPKRNVSLITRIGHHRLETY